MSEGIRVLLVASEDDRERMRSLFEETGMTLRVREIDPEELVDRGLGPDSPEILFVDLTRFGGRDGVDLVGRIGEAVPGVPVVAIVEEEIEERGSELMGAGVQDVVPRRRLSPDRLGLSLRYVLAIARAEERTARVKRRLRENREWLAATVRSIGDAVFTTDAEGEITYINPVAEGLTGWSQGEASGKDLSEVLRLEEDPFAGGSIRRGPRGAPPGEGPSGADVLLTRDGSRIPVDVTATALQTKGGDTPQGGVVVVRDISARREAEEAVQRYANRLQRLAQVGLEIISSPPGEVLQVVTDCARKLIGCRLAITSFSRTGWHQAIHAVSVADEELRDDVLSTTPLDSEIYRLVCRDNTPRRLTEEELGEHQAWSSFRRRLPDCRGWLAAPLLSPGGDNLGLIQLWDRLEDEFDEQDEAILVQLAQLASAAISNARLFEKTQRALEARDYVVAVVSHDLRSPLSAIAANTQLLRRTVEDEGARKRVETIERGVSRMEDLLEDLLQASKLALGESFPVEPAFVGLSALLEEVGGAFRALCEEKSVTLELGIPEPGLRIEADRERLLQALDNLLGNALEVSPSGSRVRLSVQRIGERVRFSVEDEGPGIDPEDLGEIFEPFRQSEATKSGASGLGLAISKGIVASHGGEIWAENRPDGGARLVFELPIRRPGVGQPDESEVGGRRSAL